MSANNQTLIKEHKGKWYVFTNIQAESWCEPNELKISSAKGVYDTRDEAYEAALKFTKEEDSDGIETEYGIQFRYLCKDGKEVNII